jgi:tetratricopeptide (TPR) repeat protein
MAIVRGQSGDTTEDQLDRMLDNEMFYAQSWLFVHYLTFDAGRQRALIAYLNAVRRGQDPIAAFEPAFGKSPDAMQADLKAYMNTQLPKMRFTRTAMAPPNAVSMQRLPKGADEVFLHIDRLRFGRGGRRDRAFWEAFPERFARASPTDPWTLRLRAWAALRAGEAEIARAAAEALLAQSPQDAEAYDLIGVSHIYQISRSLRRTPESADAPDGGGANGDQDGEDDASGDSPESDADMMDDADFWAQSGPVMAHVQSARAAFDAALKIEPNRPSALMSRAMLIEPGLSGDAERLAGLAAARESAPQVGTFTLTLAAELHRQGRIADAIRTLRRLMADPHGGSEAEMARAMTEQWSAELQTQSQDTPPPNPPAPAPTR